MPARAWFGSVSHCGGSRPKTVLPPSPPSEPYGFDFARQAYFMGLGAVGYALGATERLEAAAASGLRVGLNRIRQRVADEIRNRLNDPSRARLAAAH